MEPKIKQENYSNFGGINTKISPYQTGQTEWLDLTNLDFSTPGSLTKREGSTLFIGASTSGRIGGLYEFVRLTGASYMMAAANTNLYNVNSSFSSVKAGLLNGGIFDFVTFVDRLFACNGQDFFLFDGTNTTDYNVPGGTTFAGVGVGAGSGMPDGTYFYKYGYLTDRGFLGPLGATLSVTTSSNDSVNLSGFVIPSGFGVTSIAIYRTNVSGADYFRIGYQVGTGTFNDANRPALELGNEYVGLTLVPKYMEIYNNQLFMAGFSTALSQVIFSDIGEPQGVKPEFNFEVRTDDGDKVTALKFYNRNLLIFKEKSYHQLSGDNPDTFTLTQVSDQYGALSNRAVVSYEERCWWLSNKGIVEFDGANTGIVSNAVESIFLTMNIDAAKENAVAVHNKLRNEVWFSIPCNGATINNCTLVWDYLARAWTKFEGFEPSSLTMAKSRLGSEKAFYGGYSGNIFNFGSSLTGDSQNGITVIAKSRYVSNFGQSTEQLFRRLYFNFTPYAGATIGMTVNIRADYGSSISVARTLYQSPFQSRIDFGIPAKTISMELSYSGTDPLQFHGFVMESRKQRDV